MHHNYKKIIVHSAIIAIILAFVVSFWSHTQITLASQMPPSNTSSSNSVNPATAPYTLLTPLPVINGQCPSGSNCYSNSSSGASEFGTISLEAFIPYAYKFLLALAVVLAVFMITVGGFEYMLSGAMETKSDAKKKMTDAILGLILALCTYLILYTIDPNLVSSNNLTIPPISSTSN
ncbi:MAG: hypothetical protein KGJ35_02245 [Patescibacteria group bacterium]|nr:hypothetical protein [Patescibacteria group bacterium]